MWRKGRDGEGGGEILAEQIVEDLILGSSGSGGSYPVAGTIVNLMKDDVCWAKKRARREGGEEEDRMGYRDRDRAKFEQLPAGSSGFFFCLLIIHHARTKAELGTLMNKRQVKQGNLKWARLTGSGGRWRQRWGSKSCSRNPVQSSSTRCVSTYRKT